MQSVRVLGNAAKPHEECTVAVSNAVSSSPMAIVAEENTQQILETVCTGSIPLINASSGQALPNC